LRIDKQSLPLGNIQAVVERRVLRPKRHWAAAMVVAALLMLGGVRLLPSRMGWPLLAAGILLAAWDWFFHRKPIWVVRLHLLLDQRISVVFEDAADAGSFVAALTTAKSAGRLPE
jgi:hypothetical protein